jgi:hypothetical protein
MYWVNSYVSGINYKNLSLPVSNPIKLESWATIIDEFNRTNTTSIKLVNNIDLILTEELLTIFKSIGIAPAFIVVFGAAESHEKATARTSSWVHSDIVFKDTQWVDIPAAINWQVSSGYTEFFWWDTSAEATVYPNRVPPGNIWETFMGIHYKCRMNSDTSTFTCIEQTTDLNGAVLVRANVPHSVNYNTDGPRYSVSVRFHPDDVPTWERAIELFKDYIK